MMKIKVALLITVFLCIAMTSKYPFAKYSFAKAYQPTGADAAFEEANRLYTQAQRILDQDAVAVWALNFPMDFEFLSNLDGFKANPVYLDVVFWHDLKRK